MPSRSIAVVQLQLADPGKSAEPKADATKGEDGKDVNLSGVSLSDSSEVRAAGAAALLTCRSHL